MKSEQRLSPRAEVERAKAALGKRSKQPSPHSATQLVKDHPFLAVAAAVVGGFVVVTFKPGRTLMRQTLMAGTSVMLRKAMLKYIRKS